MYRMLLSLFILITSVTVAYGSRSIHVEWDYTPPTEPTVTGFQLYQEGTAVCAFEGASTSEGDCTVDLTSQITIFTLTAMFSDDTESPHSAPFLFNQYLSTGVVITWNSWIWFAKPGRKNMRVGASGLKEARMR